MVTLNLRRVSPGVWAIIATVLLALAPDGLPLGVLRPVARYLLAAYLPGLTIWTRLRCNSSSLVDAVLYPSLLSILPLSWIGLAAVALGVDLRGASWIAIALSLGVGFWFGWGGEVRRTKGDWVALSVSSALAVALLVVPFAANAFQAVAWDGPLHAAILSRILNGIIPPDSPMMAGQPVNYYWLYHFYSALLLRLTGWSIFQVFAVVNTHAFILFTLAGYKIAGRFTTDVFARVSAAWFLVFGINAFGWIIFLSHGSRNPDRWYSLVVPWGMVLGYSPSLGSLIHEFLDGFPFVVSFAFDLAWLDALLGRIEGERGRALLTSALILATALYLHPLSALFLAGASALAVAIFVLIARNQNMPARRLLLFDFVIVVFAAVVVTLPYAWDILHAKTGTPLSLELNFASVKSHAWSVFATTGVIGLLAAPPICSLLRERQHTVLLLALIAAATLAAALTIHVTLEAEYKFIYLLAFTLVPLIAAAANFWRRSLLTWLALLFLAVICIPTNAFTSYAFAIHPPHEGREPTRWRLLRWIYEQTPPNAILIEAPWWEAYQTGDAAFLYLDRYWFDVAIYGNRRQLIGYDAPMLKQWGYRDIGLRAMLASKLIAGQRLTPEDISYLTALNAPFFVVINSTVSNATAFDPTMYVQTYQDGEIRIYRVVLAKP